MGRTTTAFHRQETKLGEGLGDVSEKRLGKNVTGGFGKEEWPVSSAAGDGVHRAAEGIPSGKETMEGSMIRAVKMKSIRCFKEKPSQPSVRFKSYREEGQAAQWTQFFLSVGPLGTMNGKVLCSAVQSHTDLSGHRLVCLLFSNYSEGEERVYPIYC